MDDVGSYYKGLTLSEGRHWTDVGARFPGCDFLAYAVNYGLIDLVAQRLQLDPDAVHNRDGRPLLYYALIPNATSGKYQRLSSQLPMVRLLLTRCADPNANLNNNDPCSSTVWQSFLMSCQRSPRENCIKLGTVLLEYGADPYAMVGGSSQARTTIQNRKALSTVFECLMAGAASKYGRAGETELEETLARARASGPPSTAAKPSHAIQWLSNLRT